MTFWINLKITFVNITSKLLTFNYSMRNLKTTNTIFAQALFKTTLRGNKTGLFYSLLCNSGQTK